MKNEYDTLVEGISDLRNDGYNEDFNLKSHCLQCVSNDFELLATDFEVDAMFRFEGESNPSDESVLYAITSEKHKLKGLLIDAYGVYSDSLNAEMIEKLRYNPNKL